MPLASQIRPKTLKDFIGQSHLTGQGKPLRLAIDKKQLFSLIFWGPPGVGKTTLSRLYAQATKAELFELSAVSAGKADIKEILKKAQHSASPTILFLDEIHRFNKAQQDFLLPSVETGALVLIGATTENPSFEVIPPLLSRCRVFILNPLNELEMAKIIKNTLDYLQVSMSQDSINWVIAMSGGDARSAITIIENTYKLYKEINIKTLKNTLQNNLLRFDKKGDSHYNTVSAFIKSMRASQVDAALYYLARMINAGEDPKFIARRMVIFASEDIGMAQPTALVVANEVFRAVETIGYPECSINLAHGVVYLAQAPKDRSSYDALRSVQSDVKKYGGLPIPLSLRNAPTKLTREIGYGQGYQKYTTKSYLPDKLKNKKYYKK